MEHLRTQTEHSFIIVSLVLKRTPPFLATTMVAPIILIMLLTNVGLILPCESGEKMGYSITIFLTLVVYMATVSANFHIWELVHYIKLKAKIGLCGGVPRVPLPNIRFSNNAFLSCEKNLEQNLK